MLREKINLFDGLSLKLGHLFSVLPFSHNFYSWLTLFPAMAGFVMIVQGRVGWGIFLFLLASLIDVIDGAVARKRQVASGYGAFLDGSLDRVVDFLLIFSYLWLPISTPWLGLDAWVALAVFSRDHAII